MPTLVLLQDAIPLVDVHTSNGGGVFTKLGTCAGRGKHAAVSGQLPCLFVFLVFCVTVVD